MSLGPVWGSGEVMGVLRAGLNKWAKVFAGLLGLQTSGKRRDVPA